MNFFDNLNKYSNNIAIITEQSKQITYGELLGAADNIGKQIKKRCLVFVICKNCFESVVGYIGLLRAGAVVALIDSTMDTSFLLNLLDTYKPAYIYLPRENSGLTNNVKYLQGINGKTVHSYSSYVLLKTSYETDYAIHDDLALLLTTSGSTGNQKFVRQSYKNINCNAEAISQYLGITSDDCPITTMPMSYTYGLSIINSHLLKGASIILTEATLMDKRFWEMVKEHKATTFGGVPYTYEMLKKLRFAQMELPDLKYITQAGGKLGNEMSAEFTDICISKGIKFYVMYGQTEATARMSYLPWEHARTKTGSIGIAIPGGRFWLEDKNGNIIEETDKPAELVYQGDNVTLGYAESCLDLCKGDSNKGILHTGDVAKRDTDGFYYIVGREKRFLKIFGKRVNLDEVEQRIKQAGYDCVCAGTDDNLKIYVTTLDYKDQIKSYVIEHLRINQEGFTLIYKDKIPRKKSGKVAYSLLD